MKDTRIAVVQMQPRLGDIDYNLNKIKQFIQQAARHLVDIVCFPEMCLQSYNREMAAQLSVPLTGPECSTISSWAMQYRVTVLAGFAEKCAEKGGKPFISQLIALPDGSMAVYRKTHLGKSETPFFQPGNNLPVFETPTCKIGVQICWDLHFPEASAVLALKGAEVIFAPHASPVIVGDRRGIWLKYLAARAYDNTVYLAACNLTGRVGKQHFCGGALVLDMRGNLLAESFHNQEDMLICTLPAAPLNYVRSGNPRSMRDTFYLACRRPELYRELYPEACDLSD
ncbi:MAG: nitrilase-related carbon-nitrogen hydrolase [Bacillota bacterium]